MSLESLTGHRDDQRSKIDGNTRGFDNSADVADWTAFRDSVWGKELTFLGAEELASLEAEGLESLKARGVTTSEEEEEEEEPADRDDEPLPDVAPATCAVVQIPETMPEVWDLDNNYILVRSEYEEAERAAVSANARNVNAFLVTGQPGIGWPPLIS